MMLMTLLQRLRDARDVALGRKTARDATIPSIRSLGTGTEYRWGSPTILDEDREFAATREPIGHFVTFSVAEDMYDNWFTVDDTHTEGADEDLDQAVQAALTALHVQEVWTTATTLERVHGWSCIAVGFADGGDLAAPVSGTPEIRDLYPYSKQQIRIHRKDERRDSVRYGLPELYEFTRGSDRIRLHYTRVIHLASRFNLNAVNPWEGTSVLDVAMDDLATLRNIRWGLGQTIFRYGSGFPDITIDGASPAQITAFYNSGQFKDIHARTYFVHSERQTLEFKGAAGFALDPAPYYQPILESLSIATKIPEPILRGAQAGALTGSEVNEREYFKVISSAQTQMEPSLRWLIDALMASGQITASVEHYELNWVGGFEVNEKDQALTELAQEQAQQIRLEYMTIDEVRANSALDLTDLPNGEGQQLKQPMNPFGERRDEDEDYLVRRFKTKETPP